jgi:cobalt-zinc-cadmium efflux system outer membrane protein
MALASLWGDTAPGFAKLEGDLFRSDAADSFEALYQRVSESPSIEVYASEERLREAEIQLARSESESDIRWQVGIRRLEGIGDTRADCRVLDPVVCQAAQSRRGEGSDGAAERS